MKNKTKISLSCLLSIILICSTLFCSCSFLNDIINSNCEHEWAEWEADGEATCQGQPEKQVCKKCSTKQERFNTEITGIIHSFGEWTPTGVTFCDGEEQIRVCQDCGETESSTIGGGNADLHTWSDWRITVAASCSKSGVESRTCTSCTKLEKNYIEHLSHTDTVVCTNCCKVMIDLPDIDFEEYKSIGIKINNLTIDTVPYDGDHAYGTDFENIGTLTGDIFFGINENDELYGYGYVSGEYITEEIDKKEEDELIVYIENDYVYVASIEDVIGSTAYDYYEFTKLSLKSGTLQDTESTLVNSKEMISKLETWYNDVFKPSFESATYDGKFQSALGFTADQINDMIVKEYTSEGVSYSFNVSAINEFVDSLATETIASSIDTVLGEGTYADILSLVSSDEFYEYKYSDMLNYIQVDQGINLEELFNALDEFSKIVLSDNEATFEDLLTKAYGFEFPKDFDIYDTIMDEEYFDKTIMDVILSDLDEETDETTRKEAEDSVRQSILEVIEDFDEHVVLELIMNSESTTGAVKTPTDAADALNHIVNLFFGGLDLVMNYDADGNYLSTNVSYEFKTNEEIVFGDYEYVKAEMTITDKITCNLEATTDYSWNKETTSLSFEIIPNMTVPADNEKVNMLLSKFENEPVLSLEELEKLAKMYLGHRGYTEGQYKIRANEEGFIEVLRGSYSYSGTNENGEPVYIISAYKEVFSPSFSYVSVSNGECLTNDNYYSTELPITVYIKKIEMSPNDYTPYVDNVLDKIDFDSFDADEEYSYKNTAHNILYYEDGELVISMNYPSTRTHSHTLVGEKSKEATACGEIGYNFFECTKCGDSYKDYYKITHEYTETYTYSNGKYVSSFVCQNCDNVSTAKKYTYEVESKFETAPYSYAPYSSSVLFSLTANESGYYKIYSEQKNNTYVDTDLTVYQIDEDGYLDVFYNEYHTDDGGIAANFYYEIYLEAGETYVFAVTGDSSFLYTDCETVIYIELLPNTNE